MYGNLQSAPTILAGIIAENNESAHSITTANIVKHSNKHEKIKHT